LEVIILDGVVSQTTLRYLQPRTNLGGSEKLALRAAVAPDWFNEGHMALGQGYPEQIW